MSTPSPLIERLTANMERAMARERAPERRRGGRLPPLPVAAVLALALTFVVIVIVSSTSPDRERVASAPEHSATNLDDRPDGAFAHLPPVADAAGRFDTALREGDPVPAGSATERELRQSVDEYGQDLHAYEMRQVTFGDGTAVALGVGDRGICLRVEQPSGGESMGCAPTSQARLDQPRVSWSTTKRGIVVSGVMPDGVSDPVLHVADGTRVPLQSKAQFFTVEVDDGLDRLTYLDAAGAARSIPLPESER